MRESDARSVSPPARTDDEGCGVLVSGHCLERCCRPAPGLTSDTALFCGISDMIRNSGLYVVSLV